MSSGLELNPIRYTGSISNMEGSNKVDDLHVVFVSNKLFRVIVGEASLSSPTLVYICNNVNGIKIVCILKPIDDFTKHLLTASGPGTVHVPLNMFDSLFGSGDIGKVVVTLVGTSLSSATAVYLSEVCGSRPYSDSVHRLALADWLMIPRYLSVRESFSIPAWSPTVCYTEISEQSAEVTSWMGPGRAIDSTNAVIRYVVTCLDPSLEHAICTEATRILLVGPRRSSLKIKNSCILIGPAGPRRLEQAKFRLQGSPFVVINCALFADTGSLFAAGVPSAGVLVLLDNYEVLNVPIGAFSGPVMALVEDFQQVKDSSYFSEFVELPVLKDAFEGYQCILQKMGMTNGEVEDSVRVAQRRRSAKPIETVACPHVDWEDIGGLDDAKLELRELMASLRRGVLLFGPPGTGKTLLAKAIATEAKVSFMTVKGPELLSMYIGESEKNIRRLFEGAASCGGPCVVFFDEIDSLAPNRGRASDSANVMDRVVAALLSEIDALPENVLIVAATNRPDLLDPALLRHGRIDRQVYVGIPENKEPLLRALGRQFEFEHNVIETVAPLIPRTMTGSDIAALCRRAYLSVAKEIIHTVNTDTEIKLSAAQLLQALALMTPSVTEAELLEYEKLRDRRAMNI